MSIKPWEHLHVMSCDDMAQERKRKIIKHALLRYKRKPSLYFRDITNSAFYHLPEPRFETKKRYKPIRSTTIQLSELCPTLFQGKNLETYKTINRYMRKRSSYEDLIMNLRFAVLILKVFANSNIPFYIPNPFGVTKNKTNSVLISNFDKYLPLIANGNIRELSKYDDGIFMIMNCLAGNSYSQFRYDFGYLFNSYPDEYNEFIASLSQMKMWFEEQLDFFIKYINAQTITFIPELFGQLIGSFFKIRHVFIFNNSIVLRIPQGISSEPIHYACQGLGFDIKTAYTLHIDEIEVKEYE